MKIITKMAERNVYVCDECGKEHNDTWSAERCEKQHEQEKCPHASIGHLLKLDEYPDCAIFRGVERYCWKCGLVIESRALSGDLMVKGRQLAAMFEALLTE